jgi:hypothetical protein
MSYSIPIRIVVARLLGGHISRAGLDPSACGQHSGETSWIDRSASELE